MITVLLFLPAFIVAFFTRKKTVTVLLSLAVIALLQGYDDCALSVVLGGWMLLNYGLSLLKVQSFSFLLRLVGFLVVVPVLLLVPHEIERYNFMYSTEYPMLIVMALTFFLYDMAHVKAVYFVKFFGGESSHHQRSFEYLWAGIVIFGGYFFGGPFGLLVVASSFVAGDFYREKVSFGQSCAFLLLATIPLILSIGEVITVDLTLGKNILGLFLGIFGGRIVTQISKERPSFIAQRIGFSLLLTGILAVLGYFGTIKADLGGMDSYVAGMIGFAIVFFTNAQNANALIIAPILITVGVVLAEKTLNTEELALSTLPIENSQQSGGKRKKAEEAPSVFDQKGLSWNDIVGDYSIDPSHAQITFQLGPKGGITKGAIKQFSGTIAIKAVLSKSRFEVNLPLNQLTTFNAYRDESLVEEAYFNVAKFPDMRYEAKSLTEENDALKLNGFFTLRGVRLPLNVDVKYVGKTESGAPIIVGKSTIDRTKYGMKPDAKEGNVVAFEFRAELIKK
jgi:polyisoprenoid-binding protein YceI